ncbi:protein kinase [Spirulina sp. CCNP1310]|uniref:serine/threonine protein kinase n=1 Tax=Spirulina sp. CCNP1310 TaxID=3110249 RepID=UPI002B2030F2|nr:protein kinase [Spirulina sp. CCNP1310]MEA5419500.1 protein kinase [Spirulina sp. CCNP1310]
MSNDYKYSLKPTIGQGIFTATYPAIEVTSSRPVIIKTLAASLAEHEQFGQFRKQVLGLAKRLAACPHPHLPAIWESFAEDNFPYVVYDQIIGPTLLDKISQEGPVPLAIAVHWLHQIGSAAMALHKAGLKHLDIQPRNIVYRPETQDVVLVDVSLVCELTPEITQSHANIVAPGYAALEQCNPKATVTAQADLYSLGATLYFLLTGESPPPAPLLEHIPAQDWSRLPEGLPVAFQTAIFAALKPEAKQRQRAIAPWLAQLKGAIAPPPLDELEQSEQKPQPVEPGIPPLTVQKTPAPTLQPESKLKSSPTAKTRPQAEKKLKAKSKATAKPEPRVQTQTKVKKTKTKVSDRAGERFPVGALLMTSVIAASAGSGFGLSLRLNRPTEPGSTFWHVEQSFPPHDDVSQ